MQCQWKDKVLAIIASEFEKVTIDMFRYQYENNPVYRQFTDILKIDPATVQNIERIPFLPIRTFKTHVVTTTSFDPESVFESSGTTASVSSRHYVKDMAIYKESFTKGFELFYGSVKNWCVIGLLPSYLERQNSSLVSMVNELILLSGHPNSGFYLDEFDQLFSLLCELEKQKQKTLLIGVTFALIDFAFLYSGKNGQPLQHTIIMETGGMKGRRKEMIRQEVHDILKKSFHVPVIHSEYGMTELLSQAYSGGNALFRSPPWMRIALRNEEDPFDVKVSRLQTEAAVTGAINVIDLANIYSCCFIATDDAGRLYPDGSFEVLGRIDNSDLRGCSLMVV